MSPGETHRSILDFLPLEECTILGFSNMEMACRLMAIGVVPHSRCKILRYAPFGGAVSIQIGQTIIAVRKEEAKSIIVE